MTAARARQRYTRVMICGTRLPRRFVPQRRRAILAMHTARSLYAERETRAASRGDIGLRLSSFYIPGLQARRFLESLDPPPRPAGGRESHVSRDKIMRDPIRVLCKESKKVGNAPN